MSGDKNVLNINRSHSCFAAGDMLLFTTWDELELNETSPVYRKLVTQALGYELSEVHQLPLSINDLAAIKILLEEASFSTTAIESVKKLSVSNTVKEATSGLARGSPIYNELMK